MEESVAFINRESLVALGAFALMVSLSAGGQVPPPAAGGAVAPGAGAVPNLAVPPVNNPPPALGNPPAQNEMPVNMGNKAPTIDFMERPMAVPQQRRGGGPEVFTPSEIEIAAPAVRVGEPRAVVKTSMGDFTIKLFTAYAPRTVRHFMDLARGEKEFVDVRTSRRIRRPFYNGLTFHKVVGGGFIQGGCPFGTGRGGVGYPVDDEISQTPKFNKPGIVAMAPQRDGVNFKTNSLGSQFFVTTGTFPDWDGKYTVIGEVEKGMDVVERIAKTRVGPTDRPIRKVFILGIDIVEQTIPQAAAPAPKQ